MTRRLVPGQGAPRIGERLVLAVGLRCRFDDVGWVLMPIRCAESGR